MYWRPFQAKQCVRGLLPHHANERQWSVNNFQSSKSANHDVIWYWLGIIDVMAAIIGEIDSDTVIAPF